MLKDLLLQKGWAGKTISRAETVERINPIIRQFIALNHHYDALLRSMPDGPLRGQLEAAQKTARMDVGKLAETVFSCGGTAYNGTDLEPEAFAAADNSSAAIERLTDLETSFVGLLEVESGVDHQMRTRAILSVVKTNAEARLELLKKSGR